MGQPVLAGSSAHAHAAEDGMVAIFSKQRVAPSAALAQAVEVVVWVAVIPAARFLAQVAGESGNIADLRRGHS